MTLFRLKCVRHRKFGSQFSFNWKWIHPPLFSIHRYLLHVSVVLLSATSTQPTTATIYCAERSIQGTFLHCPEFGKNFTTLCIFPLINISLIIHTLSSPHGRTHVASHPPPPLPLDLYLHLTTPTKPPLSYLLIFGAL